MPNKRQYDVVVVEVGEEVSLYYGRSKRSENLDTHITRPPCDEKHHGFWVCVTHDESFTTQLQKDAHISRGRHKLGWLCIEHGLEKP